MQNAPLMSFMHTYVSPVCKETHKVSENKTLSLFLRTHISTELIQICIRYDIISEMWAVFTPTALSETMRDVFWT